MISQPSSQALVSADVPASLIRPSRVLDARAPRLLIAAILAVLLTTGSGAAFPAPPVTRSEALAALQSPQEPARAEAIAWLAELGTMADAPLLQARLRDESALVRGYAEQGLWRLWTRSGDPAIDARMAHGSQALEAGLLDEAIYDFTSIIRAKPEFAEGWNRRATAYFAAGDYARSIADCAEVLKRNPGHFGALSGLGQIYVKLERYQEALRWFRRALAVNPNMASVELAIRQIEERLREKRQNLI